MLSRICMALYAVLRAVTVTVRTVFGTTFVTLFSEVKRSLPTVVICSLGFITFVVGMVVLVWNASATMTAGQTLRNFWPAMLLLALASFLFERWTFHNCD